MVWQVDIYMLLYMGRSDIQSAICLFLQPEYVFAIT